MKPFYLTAAIPYVNAKPHLGHVLEWFQADALVRAHQLLGQETVFACGSDENSLKNVQAAEKAGVAVQPWLDEYAQVFSDAFKFFGIELTHFRRGSDQVLHWPGVQELWRRCAAAGDLYQKEYTGLYCVGCESYYTPEELVDGKCPEHLVPPQEITEKNYFFTLSKYQNQIEELLASDAVQVVSPQFKAEMLSFVRHGLEDFSVSRSVQRARGVGVPVPDDDSQVMYVWFDALAIYLTAVGFGTDQEYFEKTWPADVHVIGKGIARFHAVYWLGMLLSAGLALPKQISVHGYITANGQKMSKSLGNVIDPFELVTTYGLEPIRYYLLKNIPTHSDGDFSQEKYRETYTADLANGIGNVCSRVAKLCEKTGVTGQVAPLELDPAFISFITNCETSEAAQWLTAQVAATDQYLSEHKPWTLTGTEQHEVLVTAVQKILRIALHLQPFMPQTAQTITTHFTQPAITAIAPLFPRLSE